MDKVIGGIVFVAIVAIVGYWKVYLPYWNMSKRGRQKAWGLTGDEFLANEMFGEANVEISMGQRVGAAAAALAAGALVGGVGIGTARAHGVNFAITTHGRLLAKIWHDEKRFEARSYLPGQAGVTLLGPGSRKINGTPSTRVRIEPRDGSPPFEAMLSDGYVPLLLGWAGGR